MMIEELKKELEKLLSDFPVNGNVIDTTNIIGSSNAKDRMYVQYQNRVDSLPVDTQAIPIEEVQSFFLKYNIRRFWFKDSRSKYPVKEDEIVAFQDGINIILKSGNYINGGQVDDDLKNSKYVDFVYVYDPQKIYKKTDTFYLMTYGEYLLNNINQPIVRFYFSFTPNKYKVQKFLNEIRDYFNQRKIPFQFKTPYLLVDFLRSDTLVLYIAQNHYFYVREFLKVLIQKEESDAISEKRESILRDSLPLFVKKISRGVGFAEDPFYTLNSFGEERCEIIHNIINELTIPITIDNIVSELQNRGFNNGEFFRNPYTKFEYDFEYFNDNTNIQLSAPWDLKYLPILKYRFLEVARDYALELMERAVWVNENNFTWISYNEDNSKKGGYKLLTDEEKREIMWVLDRVLKVENNRTYFPKNVIKIIEDKVDTFEKNPKFVEKMNSWSLRIEQKFSILQKRILNVPLKEKFNKFIQWKNSSLKEKEDNIYEGLITFLQSFDIDDIAPNTIHGISREDLQKKDMTPIAKQIRKKYTNINYPMPNKFGNYEYIPTSDGKLKILMIMLCVAYPSFFDDDKSKVSLR